MVLLYQPTAPTPELAVQKWTSCQHVWTGWDGSEWDLSFGMSGLVLQKGTRGMEMPTWQQYFTDSVAVAGSLYRGSVAQRRDVFWPLKMFSDDGTEAWIEFNRHFWDTMDPDRPGVWSIIQPSGVRRQLDVQFASLDNDGTDDDHGLVGQVHRDLNLVAVQPFWRGDPITRTFRAPSSGVDYYGGAGLGGFGPPYVTLPGSTTNNAQISNPGQEPAWPVWTVHGPTTTVSFGLGGHQVSVPFAVPAGQTVTIDTAPTAQTAIDQNGNDRTLQLGAVDWSEVPRGQSVPLDITINGTGLVDVTIVPLYRRATG